MVPSVESDKRNIWCHCVCFPSHGKTNLQKNSNILSQRGFGRQEFSRSVWSTCDKTMQKVDRSVPWSLGFYNSWNEACLPIRNSLTCKVTSPVFVSHDLGETIGRKTTCEEENSCCSNHRAFPHLRHVLLATVYSFKGNWKSFDSHLLYRKAMLLWCTLLPPVRSSSMDWPKYSRIICWVEETPNWRNSAAAARRRTANTPGYC